jgi:hypothetical protein
MRLAAQARSEVPTHTREPRRASPLDVPANGRVLTDGDVEAIATATAERLAEIVTAPSATFALVDARQLARDLDVSLDYVYSHASELGAMRLGSGPKARIRFDRDHARQALEARVRPRNSKRSAPANNGRKVR